MYNLASDRDRYAGDGLFDDNSGNFNIRLHYYHMRIFHKDSIFSNYIIGITKKANNIIITTTIR